jgi:DNA gyrase subunit A
MRLGKGDSVVSMCMVEDDKQVLCITQHGYGKRTNTDEYREQGRGGQGSKVMQLTQKTGELAAMLMVRPEDEVMLITDDGTIIRVPAIDIRECGRVTQGVRLMRVAEGSRIVDVDIAAPEDDELDGDDEGYEGYEADGLETPEDADQQQDEDSDI